MPRRFLPVLLQVNVVGVFAHKGQTAEFAPEVGSLLCLFLLLLWVLLAFLALRVRVAWADVGGQTTRPVGFEVTASAEMEDV